MRTKLLASIAFLIISTTWIGCSKQDEKSVPAPTAPPTPKSTMGNATPGSGSSAGAPANVPYTPAANGAAADASNAAQSQAKQLMDQAMQYIKDNKLDLAQKSLDQLDAMKSQLPPDWAPKIEQVRSALNAAKATSGSSAVPLPKSK